MDKGAKIKKKLDNIIKNNPGINVNELIKLYFNELVNLKEIKFGR